MPKSSKRKHETRRVNRDRKQRLEELRSQQKAAERRKNFLFAGAGIVVALGLISAAVIPTVLHDINEKKKNKEGYQASPTAAEKAAGCLGVHNDPLSAGGQSSHVATPIDYSKEQFGDTRDGTPPIPPTGGRHNGLSLGDTVRFYPLDEKPRPERAVHLLEHGYIVAWYDSKLPSDEVKKLEELSKSGAMPRLIVVGWWQSELPADKHVVFTSWGRTDRCTTVSDAVASKFYQDHVNADIAPEHGLGPIGGADKVPPGQLPSAQPTATPSGRATSTPSATGSPTKK